MDNRTKGLIATIAAVVLCGCPGLFLCIFGAFAAAGGEAPIKTTLNGVSTTNNLSPAAGIGILCIALILLLIPVVVGFLILRAKPAPPSTNEPLPPAS